MSARLRRLLVVALAVKLAALVIVYAGYHLVPFSVDGHDFNFVYPIGEPACLASAFKTWDANHYLFLAEQGYRPLHISNAFFPLLPLVMRSLSVVTFGDTLVAGLLASTLFALVALTYLFLLIRRTHGEEVAFRTGLLLLAFPTAFYLGLVYTESLFLALAIGLFYYLAERRTWPAAAFAFLLSLTRPTGLLLVVPVLVALFLVPPRPGVREVRRRLAVPAAFVLGYATYLLVMLATTGDPLAGFDAQRVFLANNSLSNLVHPVDWFTTLFLRDSYSWNGFTNSLLNRAFFVLFVVAAAFAWRDLGPALFVTLLVLGLLPGMTGPLTSYARYLVSAFPLFIFLAVRLGPRATGLFLVPSAVFQIALLLLHASNRWVA